MKVKELLRTVNVAWSPPLQHPVLLAAGTAAQQLDASFNTSASLDLYALGLQEPGLEMELKASIPSEHRFHKIIWGSYGNDPSGVIVGGCDYGTIKIYSAAKMLANAPDYTLSSPDKHTGPVRAMDFNPFQANLLATGATESEIYIWDLVNTSTPMTPGSRSQPLEDVQYIAWNKQVQHILASTFSQRCVIWDLRKNEPIIKLTDANSRVRWKAVQWHPEVATQLCLASEDDQAPIIQLWDLRFATSPLKSFENHQRGVLSIAWNSHDPDLLLSCAKDNRILCWNPNSSAPNGEVICELAQTNQWNFDVSWCPRNPGLVVGSSFDGHAVVYSLLGGQSQASAETSNKIVDSFPGMDPFTQVPPQVHSEPAVDLKKAPKWLRRPFGASFGFGGKLTVFENEPPTDSNSIPIRRVIVSQVVTDPDLIQRSNLLEQTLQSEQFADFCKGKAKNASDKHSCDVWNCLGAYFGDNLTKEISELLGYDPELVHSKLRRFVPEEDIQEVTEGIEKIDTIANGTTLDGSAAFDAIAQQEQTRRSPPPSKLPQHNFNINTTDDEEGLITQAILLGNIEAAVSLCFLSKRYADAVILSMTGGPDLLARTQYKYFSEHSGALNSLINSLVSEDWAEIVKNCDIKCWKEVLVGVFTHSTSEERSFLCDTLGDRLSSSNDPILRKQSQICYICSGNLNKMIEASNESVQEVVELVTIMQKALEVQGVREVQIEGNIALVLSQYAEMLASEGNLEAALVYLGNSQEERIVTLKDRLCKALGYLPTSTQQVPQKAPIAQQYNQVPKPLQNNSYNPTPQPASINSWNTTPTKQYNAPATQFPAPMAPQVQQFPPNLYGVPNPVVQPPPTTGSNLGGSRPSSVGPQSRSKYILDPSVKSSSAYNSQNSFSQSSMLYNSSSNPASSYAGQAQLMQPASSYPAQAQPAQFANPYSQLQAAQPAPSYPQAQPAPPTSSNFSRAQPAQSAGSYLGQSQPAQPGSSYPQAQATYGAGSYPNVPQSQMFSQTTPERLEPTQPEKTSIFNPITAQPAAQVQGYGVENSYHSSAQPSGWNDPPVGKSSRAQAKTEFQAQNPIIYPLLGAAPQPEPIPNMMPGAVYQDPQAHYGQQQYGYVRPNNSATQFNKQPVEAMEPVQTVRAPEPEKPKAPIPEEHVHLKTVLDELRTQCFENARNPQIKRKIEDVSKKLEILYDCLRENKLTQNTLLGLHQVSQFIQNGDYTGGLGLHTQMVSGPDFSQIAPFMPGIKVLLQSALQLGVYIS